MYLANMVKGYLRFNIKIHQPSLLLPMVAVLPVATSTSAASMRVK